MKSFTSSQGPAHQFDIDGEVFNCATELPAGAAKLLAQMAVATDVQRMLKVSEFLDMVLLPDDAQRFATRLSDPVRPISIATYGAIIEWMLEEYGMRPTQPSGSSASSPMNGGTSSTDGVPVSL